jgi:hypothetical protein
LPYTSSCYTKSPLQRFLIEAFLNWRFCVSTVLVLWAWPFAFGFRPSRFPFSIYVFSPCFVFCSQSLVGCPQFCSLKIFSRLAARVNQHLQHGCWFTPRRRLAIHPGMDCFYPCAFLEASGSFWGSLLFPDPLMFSHLSYLRPAEQRRAHRRKSTEVAALFSITIWSLFTSVEGTRPLHISCTDL